MSSSSDDDLPLALLALKRGDGNTTSGECKSTAHAEPLAKISGKMADDEKAGSAGKGNKAADKKSKQASLSPAKRQRKTYDIPGQTRDTPDENDPLRRYYTSLYKERPGSEVGRRWCAQHGLLPLKEAEKWAAENGRGSQATQRGAQSSPSPPKKKGTTKRKAGEKIPAKRTLSKKKSTAKNTLKSPSRVRNDRIQADDDSDEF